MAPTPRFVRAGRSGVLAGGASGDASDGAVPGAAPPARVFEQICAQIREQIGSGVLQPGDKLPTERELAQSFRAGRNAVREALRSLEMAGVVRLEKGRSGGAFIRPANSARMTLAMSDLVSSGSISWHELYEARMEIMDRVVTLATARAGEADLARLEHLLDEAAHYKVLGLYDNRVERLGEFFATLAQATGNRALVMIVTAMNDTARQFIAGSGAIPPASDTLVAGLRRVLRHMRAGAAVLAAAELRARLTDLYRVVEEGLQGRHAGRVPVLRHAARSVPADAGATPVNPNPVTSTEKRT